MATVMYKGKEVEIIVCAPTWEGILPAFLAVLECGSAEGKSTAREELRRMAQAADNWNRYVNEATANAEALNNEV